MLWIRYWRFEVVGDALHCDSKEGYEHVCACVTIHGLKEQRVREKRWRQSPEVQLLRSSKRSGLQRCCPAACDRNIPCATRRRFSTDTTSIGSVHTTNPGIFGASGTKAMCSTFYLSEPVSKDAQVPNRLLGNAETTALLKARPGDAVRAYHWRFFDGCSSSAMRNRTM